MFNKAKVDDKVYSLRYGWGKIYKTEWGYSFPICVEFKDRKASFTAKGRLYTTDVQPDLYWGEPEIIAPPRPKRKIKKTVTQWAVVNKENGRIHSVWNRKVSADSYCADRIVVELTGEYEVEE